MTAQECETLNEVWYTRVQEFRASGLSGPQWCAPRGLKVKQLHYWNRKFRSADANASDTTWLALNTLPVTAPDAETLRVCVGPATITVHPGFDPGFLQQVVQALATC